MKNVSIKRIMRLFVYVGLPLLLIAPFLYGAAESITNVDLRGHGRCMLINTMKVLSSQDSSARIVIGKVKTEVNEPEEYHLWGVDSKGKIIDFTCFGAISRRTIATINPWVRSVPTATVDQASLSEKIMAMYIDRAYLVAFIATKKVIAKHSGQTLKNFMAEDTQQRPCRDH